MATKTTKPMTDAEFTSRVAEVGYVEACVESVRRDGHPVDEVAIREQAAAGIKALRARGFELASR